MAGEEDFGVWDSADTLIWDLGSFEPGGKSDPTAYLVNPATRTKTTLRLHGIPRAQYLTLAW